MTPTFRGGQWGHNLGIIHISHVTYCSCHAFTLMSTLQTYKLGLFSYLSNILSPTGQKVRRQNIFSSPHCQNLSPHFQNRGAAPDP